MMEEDLTFPAADGAYDTVGEKQTLSAPGESERTLVEGHLPPGTSEDGSPGPQHYSSSKGDMLESSVGGLVIRIKEEPLSDEEDHLTTQQAQYQFLHIKEEPHPLVVTASNDVSDCTPHAFSHIKIKMETVPAEEDCHPNATIYSPAGDHGQEEPAACRLGSLATTTDGMPQIFSHIKMESVSAEEDGHPSANIYSPTSDHGKQEPLATAKDIYRPADHIARPAPNLVPETLAYEIPVNNAPIKGANNASVYSVRQKEDTMEILYHCPSCNKGFSSNLDLARHQVIHTVDKLFICSLCGKSFTELSFLVKHQVIHTDLKRCVCQVCSACFYSETSLAKHQKTHSLPAFCSICGKCFFDKSELAIHERKHTGERPFGCQICGKHFIAKGVLNKHMLTHPQMGPSK